MLLFPRIRLVVLSAALLAGLGSARSAQRLQPATTPAKPIVPYYHCHDQ